MCVGLRVTASLCQHAVSEGRTRTQGEDAVVKHKTATSETFDAANVLASAKAFFQSLSDDSVYFIIITFA